MGCFGRAGLAAGRDVMDARSFRIPATGAALLAALAVIAATLALLPI